MTFRAMAIVILALSAPVLAGSQLPRPWFLAGNDARHYDACIEFTKEARALYLGSLPGAASGFGTIMQSFPADAYRGQRLCLSGYVKTREVSQWAGLWMRVDGAGEPPPALAFDNMQNRPIRGTTDWKRYEVVLDVPKEAVEISIGMLLQGKGEMWVTSLDFKPVNSRR